eukprot:2861020-Pleurochrysis_carterae.AAC.4
MLGRTSLCTMEKTETVTRPRMLSLPSASAIDPAEVARAKRLGPAWPQPPKFHVSDLTGSRSIPRRVPLCQEALGLGGARNACGESLLEGLAEDTTELSSRFWRRKHRRSDLAWESLRDSH